METTIYCAYCGYLRTVTVKQAVEEGWHLGVLGRYQTGEYTVVHLCPDPEHKEFILHREDGCLEVDVTDPDDL